jgi:hypothetical protein
MLPLAVLCWVAGGLVVWAGEQGRLGWRFDRRRSLAAGFVVALMGPGFVRFVIAGVAAVGVWSFVVTSVAIAMVALAGYRCLWWRSRAVARGLVGVFAVALVAPSFKTGVFALPIAGAALAGLVCGWRRWWRQ